MLCYVLDFVLAAVHGHGRGTRLGICLVQQQCFSCVIASAACVNAHKCCVMFLVLSRRHCTGMDEARALVHALCSSCVSCVVSPLLHASMMINIVFCMDLYNYGEELHSFLEHTQVTKMSTPQYKLFPTH